MTYRSASARARAFDDAVAEAMSAPVTDALDTQSPSASDPAAGAPSPEGESSDAVAAVTAIGDTSPEPDDGNRMEHDERVARWAAWQKERAERFLLPQKEFERQARLRRWQAVDPRERKA